MPTPAVAPISSPSPPAAHPAIQPLEACWHAFRRSGLHTLLEEALAVQAHSPVSGTPSVVLTSRIAKAVSLTRLVGEPPSRPEQSTALETALAPVGATLAAWASYQAARTVVLADPPLWSTLDTAGWLDTPASQMAPPLSFLIAVVPGESGVHYLGIRHDLVAHLPALSIQRLQPEPQEIPGTDATLPNCWETLLVVPAAHTPAQVIATITDRVRQPGILRPGTTTTGRSSRVTGRCGPPLSATPTARPTAGSTRT